MFVFVSSCAAQAASLPYVRIDRSLPGAVCSREAAEVFARRQVTEYADFLKHVEQCEARAEQASIRADAASWWQSNAPWLVVLAGVGAGAVGFIIGSQIGR